MSDKRQYLRRYTNLESLRCILHDRAIALLDPQTWKDNNDAHFLGLYRREKGLRSLFALCLTTVSERYHLWQVFGPERSPHPESVGKYLHRTGSYSDKSPLAKIGVRIRFDRKALIQAIEHQHGVQYGRVEYKSIEALKSLSQKTQHDPVSKLPFLKRYGFQDEREYRIIYSSKDAFVSKDLSIQLSCINRIVISHRASRRLFEDSKEQLRLIDGCETLRILHSRLTDSRTWKRAGEQFIETVKPKG